MIPNVAPSKLSSMAKMILLLDLICLGLISAVSACNVQEAKTFFGDRGSVISGISLPLLASGCNCRVNKCIYTFTQLPSAGALYEMEIMTTGNQIYLNRTSPKLLSGDVVVVNSPDRNNFGTFVFIPRYKFYGIAVVNFTFSYNEITSIKNFTLITHFNNSVPYSGEGGHMLSFDGYDDFLVASVPLQQRLNSDFPALSFSFWVKNTKPRQGQVLISAWAATPSNSSAVKWTGGRQWALLDTANLNFQVKGNSLSEGTGFDIRDSKWHFISLSWKIKSGLVDIFVDGKKKTIPVPQWEPPEVMNLMLGNMQLVTDIIPVQKAENDVMFSRSQENVERNMADSSLSPSYEDKWYAAQTMASSLLSNLNGGMGSPKDSGTLSGIPSSYTNVPKGVVDAYRYAMFGIAECHCVGYGAATQFAFGGHLDEFRMFNEARDSIDFEFAMNHMYSPPMFERYQTSDSAVASNPFAKTSIQHIEKLWIYWTFDYIYEFISTTALPILESLQAGLILLEARGSIDLSQIRMRSVQDNTPTFGGVAGKLGDDYSSFRAPTRVVSDAPLFGSALQFFSVYPDGGHSILKISVQDWENQTNVLVRIENMPIIGSLFQVREDGSIGNPILARSTVITNSDFKIAYKGDKGLCKNGVKVFNVEGELVDKDTSADMFDVDIKDVKIIPPISDPDTPPALRYSKMVMYCALFRTPMTLPYTVVQTLQNSSTLFELQALSLDKPSTLFLLITQLPLRGTLWTAHWIDVGCNDTSVSCVCDHDPLECNSGWNPQKECKNQTKEGSYTYKCMVKNATVIVGVRYGNPLNVIYSPSEFFSGNDSVSFNVIIQNSDGSFSGSFNEETAVIVVVPNAATQSARLVVSLVPNITSGDSLSISFDILSEKNIQNLLQLRVTLFPMHGTLLLPNRFNDGQSDSIGTPLRHLSDAFDITFDGFTKSNAIVRIFRTANLKKNIIYQNYSITGDPTSTTSSFFSTGQHKFKNLDEATATMNTSQSFESVCGDLGVVQSYVEFSGIYTLQSVRLMTSLPLDTFIRFVAPQNVLQGNLTTIKRATQYSSGATKFNNCPESNMTCEYPRAYNVRQCDTEQPNLLKTESSFKYSQGREIHEMYELWRGFAGEGQKSTSQNAIRDFFFAASLPTRVLVIETCGTRQSWPGLLDGGNPIDEIQGLIVRVTKGGNRGILPVGTRSLIYRSHPTYTGPERIKLALEFLDGKVVGDAEASWFVLKSRALASKYVTNLQQSMGEAKTHALQTKARSLRYEFVNKFPEDLQLYRLDSTAIGHAIPNVYPDATGTIELKIGSASRCGENDAFVTFHIVGMDEIVVTNGHNLSLSFACPSGFICDASIKQCKYCQPGTYYNDPPKQYDSLLASQIPSGFCLPCQPGYYTDTFGLKFCKPCDQGFSSTVGSSSCKPCEKGSFNPYSGGTCISCEAGQYQPFTAQSFCYPCGFLGFSTSNNSIQCLDCPENMHAEFEKSSNVAHCTCNSGYYRLSRSNDSALMSDMSCLPCPLGAFCAGMDLLPVPKNGFYTDVSLWSNGKSFFLQCIHRGVLNQCQGYPSIDYQYKHEICKFRDTDVCFQGKHDVDTFRSYKKNLACKNEYYGFLCNECSVGIMLSSRNFLGACVLCPSDALGYVGIFVRSILTVAAWVGIVLCFTCQVHSIPLLLWHFQLLAVLSDAGVQNSVTVDSFLKGFHFFMFDLNFIPWSCIFRMGVPLFFKHVVQLAIFWVAIAIVDFRGQKLVRDATLFRVQYNFLKSKISTDGINNVDRRSLRSRSTNWDNTSIDDASSVGSAQYKGEARSWKNLFKSTQSERAETPVVDLMRPNTAGSAKSHNSWYSKVSAWRKQHVKAEDAKLESRKLMSTEQIDQLRDEQYQILLATSQALAVPILYNSLVMFPCLECSDQVLRMMWIPAYDCTSPAYLIMALVGILTAIYFVAWVPGKFLYQCAVHWVQDDWDHPQFLKRYRRTFDITERKHRWWYSVLILHGPVLSTCIILTGLQPAIGITIAIIWIGFKTFLTMYMRPYLMTKHNVFTFILDLHMSIACSCALCRTNIFSANYLAFTLDRFEVSADALDGLIHIAAFLALLAIASFTILIDCIHCKVKIPPSVAIVFNVLTGKPHAVFRTFLTDAWNFWQKLNRKYAKWTRPKTSLVQFGKDVQRTETRERADVVRDSIIAQKNVYPTDSPFFFDTIESDLGEWAAQSRKVYHFINACMIRIQELETFNSKSDKILTLQSKVNCALRCLINFNLLDYEDAFQRQ
jgi:hypothetical protein